MSIFYKEETGINWTPVTYQSVERYTLSHWKIYLYPLHIFIYIFYILHMYLLIDTMD